MNTHASPAATPDLLYVPRRQRDAAPILIGCTNAVPTAAPAMTYGCAVPLTQNNAAPQYLRVYRNDVRDATL